MIYELDGVKPEIDPTAWIAPTAVLIGNVIVGPRANIWFGAVLRGDNEPIVVGEGSNIQENSVLHTDMGYPLTIGANCTIGHKAMLHGCTIADGSLIGMGATLLNGAKIGAGSLVGACALVTEGKDIPPGSLVMGAPAKVVRELDEAAQARLLKSAAGYQANARRFAAGMKPLG
ncbi:gamma carbonic anhydrase family protein [Tabrizicola oligotrophica]|uniref:Gamma carbonic anhydrase family protein n=1 Tax=Tabrizicola oligotrophica TaxID=2710650 RepID=A0A6M0QN63_9RHOB|nr:gamma carbonic anhydrase family protein [Tabrizicola oligotrophica]NEY88845.1 gamma carbonic anhydrase family protein [Tabrizicola oligotrophica]